MHDILKSASFINSFVACWVPCEVCFVTNLFHKCLSNGVTFEIVTLFDTSSCLFVMYTCNAWPFQGFGLGGCKALFAGYHLPKSKPFCLNHTGGSDPI